MCIRAYQKGVQGVLGHQRTSSDLPHTKSSWSCRHISRTSGPASFGSPVRCVGAPPSKPIAQCNASPRVHFLFSIYNPQASGFTPLRTAAVVRTVACVSRCVALCWGLRLRGCLVTGRVVPLRMPLWCVFRPRFVARVLLAPRCTAFCGAWGVTHLSHLPMQIRKGRGGGGR